MKKRLLSMVLATAMVLSLAGCKTGTETAEDTMATEAAKTTATEETTTEETTEESLPEGNMIVNGDFSDGTTGFNTYTNGGSCNIKETNGELETAITTIGGVEHGVQVYYDGFALKQGVVYAFSFDVHSSINRDLQWRIQINGGDYHAYASETVSVTDEVQHVEAEFTMEEASDPAPRLCFNMGCVESMQEAGIEWRDVEAHSVFLDNLELKVVDASAVVVDENKVEVPKIKVDQLGYQKEATKIAVFSDLEEDTAFTVVKADSGDVVYEGKLSEVAEDEGSGEMVKTGDFSDLKEEGTFRIVSGSGEQSNEFTISDTVYEETFHNLVKMLYMQRCGMELTEDVAGDFAHPACHSEQATVYDTGAKLDVSGGWHDAGDYGRYVVTGAKTVADMLLAYENNPEVFGDDCDIPESGDGINDALQEVKYELDWMLKMQDSSGGVYHKVTCKVFPETVMPQDETDELIIAPISKTATADFAAAMAMAGRIYGETEEYAEYGQTCLTAAKKAWEYAKEHISDRGFTNPEDIVTGEYPDNNSKDEYFWAAAELYKTTGEEEYKTAMADMMATGKIENYGGFGWADVAGYGAYAALTADALLTDSTNLQKDIREVFLGAADEAVNTCKANGYLASRKDVYEWGSNMGIANSGMLLLLANEIQENADYVACAGAQMHYLFGVNATGYCFVTGAGSLSPENPHHRPSMVVESCMPGMLVGGPDSNLEDPYAQAVFTETPAAKCYADNAQSYSCNEVTIYWNSPLIYLMTALEK